MQEIHGLFLDSNVNNFGTDNDFFEIFENGNDHVIKSTQQWTQDI